MPKETYFKLPEEKQEKVIRSAISEFLNHGFEKGNIGVIAKQAGVAKGSMYQYFENKKELFLYAVKWSTELLYKKYGLHNNTKLLDQTNIDIFQFIYESGKQTWLQIKEEREIILFMEEVIIGKYSSLTAESMNYLGKFSDNYMFELIRIGKERGQIRKDIDDITLAMFMAGASMKIKQHLINKTWADGKDIVDQDFEQFEHEITRLIDLIKNGMGEK